MTKQKVWECEHCGARVLTLPSACDFCKKKGEFIDVEVDKTKDDPAVSKKYDEVMDKLDSYRKGCEPEKFEYSVEE